jgi:hypothetical protein
MGIFALAVAQQILIYNIAPVTTEQGRPQASYGLMKITCTHNVIIIATPRILGI